jgi:hypothetical protein
MGSGVPYPVPCSDRSLGPWPAVASATCCLEGEQETSRRGNRKRGGDATPDVLLKHPDATLATYV